MSFPETADRFIAYFDIMGFKDLVYRNDHSYIFEIIQNVSNLVSEIKAREEFNLTKIGVEELREIDAAVIMPVFFSDTILFISRSDGIHDARKILLAANYFINSMFEKSIPVKGAISHGTFTASFETSKFFGRPLIDAYLLAEEVQFYGSVFHHSFEKKLSELDEPDDGFRLRLEEMHPRKKVHMKGGATTHSLVEHRSYADIIEKNEDKNWGEIIKKLYTSVSGSTRKYVDNTLEAYNLTD